MSKAPDTNSNRASWLGLTTIAMAFGIAAVLTWRKWPDIIVDFGTQLYIPWRLSDGAVLYRDIFYFAGGPLSQYANALLFKIFGVSFLTLIVMNLILAGGMIVLIYREFLVAANLWTAAAIALAITLVFTFSEYTFTGNYDYIAPYSHEAVHGLVLSVFTLVLLSRWVAHGKMRFLFAAGICFGMVFLTKPEIFIALAAATAAAFLRHVTRERVQTAARSLLVFLACATMPSLLFFLFFLRVEGWRASLRAVTFGWLPAFYPAITENPYYRWCMGLDNPRAHLQAMAIQVAVVVLVVAACAAIIRLLQLGKSPRSKARWLLRMLLVSPLVFWAARSNWCHYGAPLPLLCLITVGLLIINRENLPAHQIRFPFLWSVFGTVLLLKLGLNPRIWHYGFVLAMPATVSVVYLFVWVLPVTLEKRWAIPARQFSLAAGIILLAGFGNLFNQSQIVYALKDFQVGNGMDNIYTYNPAVVATTTNFSAAVAWIDHNMPRDATMAVLPEGVMLNYLTRHVNPTPCIFWDPSALTMFGQSNMTQAFEKNAPDYVAIIHRDSSDFGVGYFGKSDDYGGEIMRWIQDNYSTQVLFGSEPLQTNQFGIKIMKRLPAPKTGGREPPPD